MTAAGSDQSVPATATTLAPAAAASGPSTGAANPVGASGPAAAPGGQDDTQSLAQIDGALSQIDGSLNATDSARAQETN